MELWLWLWAVCVKGGRLEDLLYKIMCMYILCVYMCMYILCVYMCMYILCVYMCMCSLHSSAGDEVRQLLLCNQWTTFWTKVPYSVICNGHTQVALCTVNRIVHMNASFSPMLHVHVHCMTLLYFFHLKVLSESSWAQSWFMFTHHRQGSD